MAVSFLHWVFGLKWWLGLKAVSAVGAPVVCAVGILWFIYDRYTGGV